MRQRDKFTKRALSEGYKARSVYKLKSINSRFRLIKPGIKVLDLGAFPGSWSQYCLELDAKVDAVDLKDVKIDGIKFIKADIFNDEIFSLLSTYDLVLSDIAPNTTGIRFLDSEKSYDLGVRALEIAKKVLVRDGNFVCKLFQSEKFNEFVNEVKKNFKLVRIVKPEGSKKLSREMYIVAIRKI